MLYTIFKKIMQNLSGHGLGKYKVISEMFKVVRRITTPEYFEVFGNKLYIHKSDDMNLVIQQKTYEKETRDMIIKELRKDDIVVDCGANIGYFSLFMAELVGKNGKVIAFEPEPSNFKLLKHNIKVNNYENIIPMPFAVSDKLGSTNLKLESTVAHYLTEEKTKDSIQVDAITLDSYFENYQKKIRLVKMDVEGYESEIINGMRNMIKNNDLRLVVEFSNYTQMHTNHKPVKLLELIDELGFEILNLQTNKMITKPFTDEVVDGLGAGGAGGGGTNIFCYKKDIENN